MEPRLNTHLLMSWPGQAKPSCVTQFDDFWTFSWEISIGGKHIGATIELSVCGSDAALCQITL